MITLRPYQDKAVESTLLAIDQGNKNILLHLATGLGKTTIFIEIMNRLINLDQQRCLIMAQDTGLIRQTFQRILDQLPELSDKCFGPQCYPALGVEMGGQNNKAARCLVATRQKMAHSDAQHLKEALTFGAFDLLILDEADLSITLDWQLIHSTLLEANPNLICIGVTATTERSDGRAMGIRFHHLSFSFDVRQGIMEGWLKGIEGISISAMLPNLEVASPLEVDQWMNHHYDYWKQFGGADRYTLHFLPDLELSRQYCRFLQAKGVKAVHVDSMECVDINGYNAAEANMTYWEHRLSIEEEIQSGVVQYVCNFNIFGRGWDWRYCNMILNSIGSKSNSTFTQRLGRGTRLPPNVNQLLQIRPKLWKVTWNDGLSITLEEDKLPFFPTTLFLDFAHTDTTIQTVASLFGDMVIPDRIQKIEEEEGEEKEQVKVKVITPQSVNIIIKPRNLFRGLEGLWYEDIQHDISCTLGRDIPYLIYITAPQTTLARQLYGSLQRLRSNISDASQQHILLARYNTLYDLTRQWTVWLLEGQLTKWGSMEWEHAAPIHKFFSLQGFHPTQDQALSAATLCLHQVNNLCVEKGFEVDYYQLKKYKRYENEPTDKQQKKLQQLLARIKKTGWKNAFVQTPQTLNEMSQAINHINAKSTMIKLFKAVADGSVMLYLN